MEEALAAAAAAANAGARVRTAMPPDPAAVLDTRYGMTVNYGCVFYGHGDLYQSSVIGAAWYTAGSRKFVRVWGWRGSNLRKPPVQVPGCDDRGSCVDIHLVWSEVFPQRAARLRALRRIRLERILSRYGPLPVTAGIDLDRIVVLGHAPGVGVMIGDRRTRPREVRVITAGSTPDECRVVPVARRFGDDQSKTFQRFAGDTPGRVAAALRAAELG
jgi:hypothetical protein